MIGLAEDGLGALERIIAKGEARRVDTMIQIAFLEADDLNSTEAHADLAAIEKLLRTMRKQQHLLMASACYNTATEQEADCLGIAA
ncbi:hypothetical protein [Methylobacterium sp. J-068]|uniref:hypothetical protein n=1 Tax=Methylobacterium sp. J-068 TaxID=2836649 RepID=UPI001FBB8297|nr:hypothetical protein [Methylobacterium sp. J-068]MCJ2032754.1 hypothetical protein [Methylobacterium sp. J-068]